MHFPGSAAVSIKTNSLIDTAERGAEVEISLTTGTRAYGPDLDTFDCDVFRREGETDALRTFVPQPRRCSRRK